MKLREHVLGFTLGLGLVVGITTTPVVLAQSSATPAASPTAAGSIEVSGDFSRDGTLTVAELQSLPQQSIDVTFQSGQGEQHHSYTGVNLIDVINLLGINNPNDNKNPLLGFYFSIVANDGYQVILSGGELDPSFGNAPIMLAWEEDGAALTGDAGPLRLVVPGDTKGGRYVNGVISIEAVNLGTNKPE
jgi:DMSO/TMAO reductase YedYZ molybdopterin-dependent catalytic subunit